MPLVGSQHARAADDCTNVWVDLPTWGPNTGVDVSTLEVDSLGIPQNAYEGISARIGAPSLSSSVEKRILRAVVLQRDLEGLDYLEWGWLRDPGAGNIAFYWARNMNGNYTEDRSDVYPCSARTAKIELREIFVGILVDGFGVYVDGVDKGPIEHPLLTAGAYAATLAERWNTCDPGDAEFDVLQVGDGDPSNVSYSGWREMTDANARREDPTWACKKGMIDVKWWTVQTTSSCLPDLDST